MALACPYKPVAQRESLAPAVHAHRFEVEMMLDNGSWVQDCACGHRRRIQKSSQGSVAQEYDDGVVPGGSSLDNAIFSRREDGRFIDRWSQ